MNWLNILAAFADEGTAPSASTNQMSQTTAIVFVVLGILALIMAVIVLVFYIYVRKRQRTKINEEFKTKTKKARYDIFNFWINYVYVFLIAVGIIAGIILLPIGITNLV